MSMLTLSGWQVQARALAPMGTHLSNQWYRHARSATHTPTHPHTCISHTQESTHIYSRMHSQTVFCH